MSSQEAMYVRIVAMNHTRAHTRVRNPLEPESPVCSNQVATLVSMISSVLLLDTRMHACPKVWREVGRAFEARAIEFRASATLPLNSTDGLSGMGA